MQNLFDNNFFMAAFKYSSFKHPTREIRRLYFRNAIYEGEVEPSSQSTPTPVPCGIGLLISNRGTIVYGKFKSGKLFGECNIISSDGSFARGGFTNNRADGPFIYSLFSGDTYLMNFVNGNLEGFITYFPHNQPIAFLLQFGKNQFKRVIKSFDFTIDEYYKSKIQIIRKFFEDYQVKDSLLNEKDLQAQTKRLTKEFKHIGSYEIGKNEFIYNGVFDNRLNFCGMGILVKSEDRVEIGNFREAKIHKIGMLFENNYLYFGFFNDGDLDGKVIVRSLKTGAYKYCSYEEGTFKGIISQGSGMPDELLFEFRYLVDVFDFLNQTGDATESNLTDINFLNENFELDFFDEMRDALFEDLRIKEVNFKETENAEQGGRGNHMTGLDQKFTFRGIERESSGNKSTHTQDRSYSEQHIKNQTDLKSATQTGLVLKLKDRPRVDNTGYLPQLISKLKRRTHTSEITAKPAKKLKLNLDETKKLTLSKKTQLLTGDLQAKMINFEEKNDIHKNICWDFDDNYQQKKQFINENHFQINRNGERRYINP
jgi:hypothetical protein